MTTQLLLLSTCLLALWTGACGQESLLDDCFPEAGDRVLFEGCKCYGIGKGVCEEGNDGAQVTCDAQAMENFPRPNGSYPEIACLHFTHGRFTELKMADLAPFPNLKQLELVDGRLDRVYNQAFSATLQLRRLIINKNLLTMIPDVTELRELAILDLGDNEIQSITHQQIAGLQSLSSLHMEKNDIKILQNGVFLGLTSLSKVSMPDNPNLRVDDETFILNEDGSAFCGGKQCGITEVDLSNTAIDKMPYKGLRDGLTMLNLAGTRNLKYFDAQSPAISAEKYFRNLTFPLLQSVSFHYSALCCQFRPLSFLDTHRLTVSAPDCYDPPITNGGTDSTSNGGTNSTVVCYNTSVCPWAVASETNYNKSLSTEEFCASVPTDCCSTDVCPEGCSGGTLLEEELLCVQINPTKCYSNVTFPVLRPDESCTTANCSSKTLQCRSSTPCSPPPTPSSSPCPPEVTDRCSSEYCRWKVCIEDGTADDIRVCDTCRVFPCGRDIQCDKNGKYGNCECEEPDRKRSLLNYPPDEMRQMRATQPFDPPPEGWFYLYDNSSVICAVTRDDECVHEVLLQTAPFSADGTSCTPENDPFNPCEDLLGSNHALRVLIWPVIIFALLGNGIVIFVIVGYVFVIRRMKMDSLVIHLLYLNLAVADFIMGVYLFTIAVVDLDTFGRFFLEDVQWRTGPGCGFAGFLAITSTVASVYMLILITFERVYTIRTAMYLRKVSLILVCIAIVCGWILAVIMGLHPLFGVSSYSSVAICLPFDTSTVQAKVYVTFILVSTGLAFLAIIVCYAVIFYEIYLSKSKRRLLSSNSLQYQTWRNEVKVVIRMALLAFTNIIAWFPIAFLALTATFGHPLLHDVSASKFIMIFIFPINACLNPILYSLSTKLFRQNFCSLMNKFGLFRKYNRMHERPGIFNPDPSTQTSAEGGRRDSMLIRLLSFSFLHPPSTEATTNREVSVSRRSVDDPSGLVASRLSCASTASGEDPMAYQWIGRRSSNFSECSNEEPQQVVFGSMSDSSSFTTVSDEPDRERGKSTTNTNGLPNVPEETELEISLTTTPSDATSLAQREDEDGYYTDLRRDSDDRSGATSTLGARLSFPTTSRKSSGNVSMDESIQTTTQRLGSWETESMKEMEILDI